MRNFENSQLFAWTGQLGQDKWVARILGAKRYFVDIGAADGVRLSNTYVLEKYLGWCGLCVEPSDDFQTLRQVRNCLVDDSCVADSDAVVDFQIDSDDRIFSGIADSVGLHAGRSSTIVRKKTIALTKLLDRYGCPQIIDYLSLDTEGSEYLILKNFDFQRYCFRLITVEHNFEEPKRANLFELLRLQGYSRVLSVWHEDWYVHPKYLSFSQLLKVRAIQLASRVPPRWHPKMRQLAVYMDIFRW